MNNLPTIEEELQALLDPVGPMQPRAAWVQRLMRRAEPRLPNAALCAIAAECPTDDPLQTIHDLIARPRAAAIRWRCDDRDPHRD